MKLFQGILSFAATTFLAVSCTTSYEVDEPQAQKRIPININMDIWQTRATDAGYELNDRVGIFVVNNTASSQPGELVHQGNHVDNMKFTRLAAGWNPDEEIYWADKQTKADIYCYHPHSTSLNSVKAYPFQVKADQSTEAGYKASDFLWGKASQVAPTAESVPVTTYHTFSNILVYLKPGNGFTEETLGAASKEVKICSVRNGATINLATGVATATGAVGTVLPKYENNRYRALIVPQQVAAGSNLIRIKVDETEYTFARGFTFEPNVQHTFTVTVNKTNGGIDIGVGGWETDDTDNGGNAE